MSIQLLPSSRTTAIATVNEIVPYRYIMTTTPGQTVQLRDIDVLARSNCKIKDPQRVERIINDIISGGNSELQVVTDFDFTLTKQKTDEGKPVLSSFGMFNKCKSLPKSFLDESKKLYQKYRPLEICPRITQDEKRKHMENWWQMSDELLKWVHFFSARKKESQKMIHEQNNDFLLIFNRRGFAFDPNEIDELAKQYSHALRDGTHDLFQRTHEMNVPVLVFSAGLGDSIKAVLKHEQILLSNVKLVSNFLKYKNGMVDGFSEEFPLIHTFNKNETVLEGTEYYDMVHNRQHVILMGYVFIFFK